LLPDGWHPWRVATLVPCIQLGGLAPAPPIGCLPVKNWTFTTYTIAAFCCSGLAVLLLIVNAVTGSQHVSFLLPVAVVALVLGGILSIRARVLRYRSRDITKN
jgi:membrane protein DedA with SNARE-associated domain